MAYSLFTDGGARGNPGPAACAFFLFDEKFILVDFSGKYLGETTNNQAEYWGLITGLKQATKIGVKSLQVFLDSELLVKQLKGMYKVKDPDMKVLNAQAKKLSSEIENVTFTHVPRIKNRFADKMVNVILDSRLKA